MKLVELVKRKFVHLNLAYSSQMAAPTIGAACTTAETTTKLSRALKKRLNTNKVVCLPPLNTWANRKTAQDVRVGSYISLGRVVVA